jgi:hypothetical protein
MTRAIAGLSLLLSVGRPAPADALKFEPIDDDGRGRAVLLVRDCGDMAEDWVSSGRSRCAGQEESFSGRGQYPDAAGVVRFYGGDAQRLRAELSARTYQEVWLLSGGGDLVEGIDMGHTLRAAGMSVRVPNRETLRLATALTPRQAGPLSCVSACTVAFMGGLFRAVDDGATYQVHSASGFSDLGAERRDALLAAFEAGGTRALALAAAQRSRSTSARMLRLFHDALVFPLANAAALRRQRDEALGPWERGSSSPDYPEAESRRDAALIQLEGAAAMQDMLMKLERRAMDGALADLQRLAPRLGPRTDKALAMLVAMYDVSIKESFILTPETLFEMGYVTQDVDVRH